MKRKEDRPQFVADGVDCHVHIFTPDLTLAPSRRYQPDYGATPEALIETLEKHGLGKALIVQPSFLGTDNTYLLAALIRYPGRFRGVAVVDPSIDRREMRNLAESGVVGVRLNAIGQAAPDLGSALYRRFAESLADLDLFVEIQAEGSQWNDMAPMLADLPCDIVIDHFGRTPAPHESGGFDALLGVAQRKDVWFKFSAPYRFGNEAARDCARMLVDTVGTDRIVWGSDWPWTQFEGRHSYADSLGWLAGWVGEDKVRDVLTTNAARLLRFT